MKVHQRTVAGEVVIGGVNTKVGISNGGTRHDNAVDNLLKERRGVVVGVNVVNGEGLDGERKVKRTAYLTKEINRSHDKQSNHMTINKRSETDQGAIIEKGIGN